MKTPNVRPAASPPAAGRTDQAKKTGAFAKAMEEAATPAPLPGTALPLGGPVAAETHEVKRVQLPPALEGLVTEIHVAAQGNEVRIDFDSKTLDGLQVRITRDQNKLRVELNCRSAELGRFLAPHVDQLSAALQARGYAQPAIEVRQAPRTVPHQPSRGQGQQKESGQQSGRQR